MTAAVAECSGALQWTHTRTL